MMMRREMNEGDTDQANRVFGQNIWHNDNDIIQWFVSITQQQDRNKVLLLPKARPALRQILSAKHDASI